MHLEYVFIYMHIERILHAFRMYFCSHFECILHAFRARFLHAFRAHCRPQPGRKRGKKRKEEKGKRKKERTVGPSRAGKTTLTAAVGRALAPLASSAAVHQDHYHVGELREVRSKIVRVTDEKSLLFIEFSLVFIENRACCW